MAGWIMVTFFVSQAAMIVLACTLYRVELSGKRLDARLRELREAARMSTAEKYVTAAYCVVFALVLVYVVIIALKLARLEREVDELAELARERQRGRAGAGAVAVG